MVTRPTASVDDVLRLASAGQRFELVGGELVEMTPTGFEHGNIEGEVGFLLRQHVKANRLGVVVVGDVLFQLDPAGHVARAPDVAFIRRDRLPRRQRIVGPFVGAPDLAVEVVSPGDSAGDIQQKVADWLAAGTAAVLLIYPNTRHVILWRGAEAAQLSFDDELHLDPVVPGFHCSVHDLFPPDLDEDD